MNDETITFVVLVATLSTFVFIAVQLKCRQTSAQRSLGEMYRPAPKILTTPRATGRAAVPAFRPK